MTHPTLPNQTHIDSAHFRVIDLDRALGFYRDVLGFTVTEEAPATVALSASPNEPPILRLTEHPSAVRKPQRSIGLYHVAILMPSRQALGRILNQMLAHRYPIGGASDHLVSEALYLSDPDGNGLEIYRDRPRSEWRMNGEQVEMATEALDVDGVLAAAGNPPAEGVIPGTIIGHVHLHVSDLARAEAFYSDLLGFDVVQRSYPGALFVSAGGYHHHIGLNIWAGKAAPPPNAVGLEAFTIAIPGEDAWRQVVERTHATTNGNSAAARDQDGNTVLLKCV
ncbi:MAG TPA: VOC family protein [Phototrophicaceae bacterium]|nr:VOC family protein [Phototrophicaceae bacterium]